MASPREYKAGSSSLVLGCDSYTSPAELGDQELIMGQNIVCRGGIVQTRPGTRSLLCAPDGNFQGCTLFTPANGVAQLVFAVNGAVYVSSAPFTSYRRLWTLQFSLTARQMAWAVCLKSTDYDNEGNLIFLDNPYSVLVMQDGLTRAAYWDGSTAAHINPAHAPDYTDTPVAGYQGTPVGLWMIWSGNRLWVSRGNQIYASDIGNPLKFTESQYLNEGRAFYLASGPCTGMIEVPSGTGEDKGFIAFTETDGTLFQSYIQDRTQWLSTPLFQNTILPNVGCVAARSLVTQYGLNWWFSPRGLTNLNAAFRQNLSSRIDYQDNQMMSSKAYLSPELSGICGTFYENYLMMSVPSADVLNRHTWVLDQAPMEGNVNAWTGFWTGWRPIEWCRGVVNGTERVFFGSVDYDGKNRIWEAMLSERKDNGCPITCYAQLRDHAAGDLDSKRYEWSKFFLSQILGEVHLNVYMASTKGAYQLQKEYRIVATEGQIYSNTQYSEAGPLMIGNRVQSRTIRTPADPKDNECNACGVESKEGNKIDYAFTHLLVWSGQMGIRAYQMHMRESPERIDGDCEEPETGPRVLNAQGCSGLELFVQGEVFPTFRAVAEGSVTLRNGAEAYIQRVAVSGVSQADADRRAECAVAGTEAQLGALDVSDISDDFQIPGQIGGEDDLLVISTPQDTTDEPCTPLYITEQPDNQEVDSGDPASFSVAVSGTSPQYQWQVSTNGGVDWANLANDATYSGVDTDTLEIAETETGMNDYEYRCIVTNECDTVISDAVLLTVNTAEVEADMLVVAGGGGGGSGALAAANGGGGGSGGVIVSSGALDAGTSYPVVVGAGGPASTNGSNSTFFGLTAIGGGKGGALNPSQAPAVGGSGGGGGISSGLTPAGAAGTVGQGNAGGTARSDSPFTTGGGGGAGAAGSNGNNGGCQGCGGAGVASSISGASVTYGGGGGGSSDFDIGANGGLGGGGRGAKGAFPTVSPVAGTPNTGGGGGGGASGSGVTTGAAGGSGVVIVSYVGAAQFTGGTITSSGGRTIHTFTSSGTLAPL